MRLLLVIIPGLHILDLKFRVTQEFVLGQEANK